MQQPTFLPLPGVRPHRVASLTVCVGPELTQRRVIDHGTVNSAGCRAC